MDRGLRTRREAWVEVSSGRLVLSTPCARTAVLIHAGVLPVCRVCTHPKLHGSLVHGATGSQERGQDKTGTGGHRTCVLPAPPVCPWPSVYPISPSLHPPLSLHPPVPPSLCPSSPSSRCLRTGCCSRVYTTRHRALGSWVLRGCPETERQRETQMERHRGSRPPKLGQQPPQSLHFCPALDPGLQGEHIWGAQSGSCWRWELTKQNK